MKSIAVILCGCLFYCAVQVSARVYETSDSIVVEGIHLFISSLSQSFAVPLLTCQRLLAAGFDADRTAETAAAVQRSMFSPKDVNFLLTG